MWTWRAELRQVGEVSAREHCLFGYESQRWLSKGKSAKNSALSAFRDTYTLVTGLQSPPLCG